MEEVKKYAKSINPQPEQQAILIYGSKYKLWRNGDFIGIAEWRKDNIIGDSFQTDAINEEGNLTTDVYIADYWELII